MSTLLLNYTRTPINNIIYDPKLAYSMHLALKNEDGSYEALNHNSGVLFAKATENKDGSVNAKSIKKPFIFPMKDGGYGIIAVRTDGDGGDDMESMGSLLLFATKDFAEYEEIGLIRLGGQYVMGAVCRYDEANDRYVLVWRGGDGKTYTAATRDITALAHSGDVREATAADMTAAEIAAAEITAAAKEGTEKTLWDAVVRLCDEDMCCGMKCAATDAEYDPYAVCRDIEGAVPHNAIMIPDDMAQYLRKKLSTPRNVRMTVPQTVKISVGDDIRKAIADVTATAHYSDGSTAKKKVDWEIPDIDCAAGETSALTGGEGNLTGGETDSAGGETKKFTIKGKVHRDHFEFPVAYNRADPCVAKWEGKYYFIATNDADSNHTLYIREADTLAGLVDAKEQLILDSSTYEDIGGLLWAPEFHTIEGRLYIFHAATPGEFFYEESHIMELKEGGNPANKDDWSRPRRVVRKDGSDICEAGKEITLDMTCFVWEGDYYVVWSQRQFLPKDLGAWLYIAKLNPKEPWKLLSDPVVLSKPEYGWANNHTFVDEGPYALIRDGKLYLTFSSAAVDTSYVVGLLTAEKGANLLDVKNFKKKNYPILTSRSVPGEYGTGHNAYVEDEDGNVWNTYHARPGTKGVRSSGIRRVHFDVWGEPRLDVTEELDVAEELQDVEMLVEIVP